jgi:hypothetical protein
MSPSEVQNQVREWLAANLDARLAVDGRQRWGGGNGATRMAVRFAPTSAATSETSSFRKRIRSSREPPYSSVRTFEPGKRAGAVITHTTSTLYFVN